MVEGTPDQKQPAGPKDGQRAALVTGASRGIGFAIARMLAEEGYALTVSSRTPAKLEPAAERLAELGADVFAIAADVADEEAVKRVVALHEDRFGRLDLLVNNAGIGIGGAIDDFETKHMDLQLLVNLRSIMLFYREALPHLRRTAREHRDALVINMSSIAGKEGQPLLGVYSATKHGVVGFTQSMHRELSSEGIKSCVLCPGFVDTDLSDYMKHEIPAAEMIQPKDMAEAVRSLLRMSPYCVIPEMILIRPGSELS